MCRPLAYHWDKSIPGGKCGNIMVGYKYFTIPNLLTDIIMLILPLPAIYKLQGTFVLTTELGAMY